VGLSPKYEGLPKNRFKAHIPAFASFQHWTKRQHTATNCNYPPIRPR